MGSQRPRAAVLRSWCCSDLGYTQISSQIKQAFDGLINGLVDWFQSKVTSEASSSSEMKVTSEASSSSEMVSQSVVNHSNQHRDTGELANWDQEHVDWMQQMMQAPLDSPTNVQTQRMQPISDSEAQHCRNLLAAEIELAANIRASLEATVAAEEDEERSKELTLKMLAGRKEQQRYRGSIGCEFDMSAISASLEATAINLDSPTNVQRMQPISDSEAQHCRDDFCKNSLAAGVSLAEIELAANIRASLEATAAAEEDEERSKELTLKKEAEAGRKEQQRIYEELARRDLAELSLVADQNAALLIAEEEAEVSSQPS